MNWPDLLNSTLFRLLDEKSAQNLILCVTHLFEDFLNYDKHLRNIEKYQTRFCCKLFETLWSSTVNVFLI